MVFSGIVEFVESYLINKSMVCHIFIFASVDSQTDSPMFYLYGFQIVSLGLHKETGLFESLII